ncbi:hypothetical protein [Klebsiella variicola]|uniref:hypothetical protein n=1 Tax=Klebsiella variicola TaxID=244366 RepID=UPI000D74EEC1|nr:hypothetical protein [Klebsiella variicola]PXM06485.1 hypothetical protein DMT40_17850 [Klebsiella variicola]
MEPSHFYSYFVKDASHLLSIKNTQLRNMLAVGSCQLTPLVKKATVVPENISNGYVYTVRVSVPGALKERVFELNDQTRISFDVWFKLFMVEFMYPDFLKFVQRKEALKEAISELEDASIEFGKALQIVESGGVEQDEVNNFLKKHGKRRSLAHRNLSKMVM